MRLGIWISCYSFLCPLTESPGLLCPAVRNTSLNVQMSMLEVRSLKSAALMESEALSQD